MKNEKTLIMLRAKYNAGKGIITIVEGAGSTKIRVCASIRHSPSNSILEALARCKGITEFSQLICNIDKNYIYFAIELKNKFGSAEFLQELKEQYAHV